MMCYRDKTFCSSYLLCKRGHTCDRALTPKIEADAEEWWGKPGAPICIYEGLPDCFVPFFEME